jgi:tetratricopeptide (TPR) repeat protein
MNISVIIMSDVVVHTEKHKPSWFWPVVVAGCIVLAGALGAGLRVFINHLHPSKPSNFSGLPSEVDDIQKLRVSGKEDEAITKIKKALDSGSLSKENRYSYYMQLGSAYYDKQKWDDALKAFQGAYALNPIEDATYNIAETYAKIGNAAKAIEYYQKSIKIMDPTSPVASDDKKALEAKIEAVKNPSTVKPEDVYTP